MNYREGVVWVEDQQTSSGWRWVPDSGTDTGAAVTETAAAPSSTAVLDRSLGADGGGRSADPESGGLASIDPDAPVTSVDELRQPGTTVAISARPPAAVDVSCPACGAALVVERRG